MKDQNPFKITPLSIVLMLAIFAAIALTAMGCHKAGDMSEATSWDEFATPEVTLPSEEGTTEETTTETETEGEPTVEIPDPEETPNPYNLSSVKFIKLDGEEYAAGTPLPLRFTIKSIFSRALSDEEKAAVEAGFKIVAANGRLITGTFTWNTNNDELDFAMNSNLDYAMMHDISIAGVDGHFKTHVHGDINGDGHADLLIGEPGFDSSRGRVLVIGGQVLMTLTPYYLIGATPGEAFGSAVAMIGDVNADGYEDMAVGATKFDSTLVPDIGRIYVYLGPDLSRKFTIDGESVHSYLGAAIAGCDLDNNGYSDIVVGAPGYGPEQGQAWVLKGAPALPLSVYTKKDGPISTPSGGRFGTAIACLEDHNYGGIADVAIGAPGFESQKGVVEIRRGLDLEPLTKVPGENPNDRFGSALASIPDLSGDKRIDFIVGAPGFDLNRGAVLIFAGSDNLAGASAINKMVGEPGSEFGSSVLAIPDLTGDNKSDVLIGAPKYFTTQGKIYAASTAAPIMTTLGYRTGDAPDAGLGNALALTHDLDGDGKDEVVAGEKSYGSNRGEVLILKPSSLSTAPFAVKVGDAPNQWLGASMAGK